MKAGTWVLLAVAAWALLHWARGYVRDLRPLPAGARPPPPDLRALSPVLHDDCEASLRAFAAAYRRSFRHGGCTREAVLELHDQRRRVLECLYGLRMRLPNDLEAEARLTRHVEETDGLLLAYIAEVQARCPEAALLHPGPLDDAFYRQHWRAHNDEAV